MKRAERKKRDFLAMTEAYKKEKFWLLEIQQALGQRFRDYQKKRGRAERRERRSRKETSVSDDQEFDAVRSLESDRLDRSTSKATRRAA